MECGDKSKKDLENSFKRVNPSCILYTLAKLIQDPISTSMIDRQILLLEDLLLGSPCGFWVQDLPNLNILLGTMLEKQEAIPSLVPYLNKLLKLCAYPPLLTWQSEILQRRKDVEEHFNFLGYILVVAKDQSYKLLTLNALRSIQERNKCLPKRCISLQVCVEAIESSNLPDILANLIELYHDDLYIEVLKVTLQFAKMSNTICYKMLRRNILTNLMIKLDPNWEKFDGTAPSHDEVDIAQPKELEESLLLMSVLIKALSSAPESIINDISSPGPQALFGLRYCLRVLVVNCRKVDCNFFLSILLKFLDFFSKAPVFSVGLIDDICILAVATEFGTSGTWAAQVHFDVDNDGFEFKQLLLLGVWYCTKHLGSEGVLKKRHVIPAILKLIAPQLKSKWISDHANVLRYTGLTVLERIMVKYNNNFMETNGILRIFLLVDYYMLNPYRVDILIAALKCINTMIVISKDLEMMNYCLENNLNALIQAIITNILKKETLNSHNQTVLCYCFNILTILAIWDKNICINLSICGSVIKRVRNLRPDDIRYDPRMMVSVLSCIWALGTNSDSYFLSFCDHNGIYGLLDIIKDAQFVVQVVGLGLLVDLCEEGTAIPYMISWRKDNMNLLQMLLKIFREENARLGVDTSEAGVINDPQYPLMGKLQKQHTKLVSNIDVSPAITDMEFSCRPKIYAIIHLLSVTYSEKVSIGDDYYKIYNTNLCTIDKLTKLVCESYLALKMGEAWVELKSYLQNISFDVMESDHVLIESMLQHYSMCSLNIQKAQSKMVQLEKDRELVNEEEFYNILREGKLASALEALTVMGHVAKTTESIFRLSKNINDRDVVKNMAHTHRTFDVLTSTAEIENQKISIQSEHINTEEPEPPEPVSPYSDSVPPNDFGVSNGSIMSSNVDLNCEGSME